MPPTTSTPAPDDEAGARDGTEVTHPSDHLDRARELVAAMTVEEKASLTSGQDFWSLKPVERLGVPGMVVTDGPHGVRIQAGATDHLGLNEAVPATCFPTASALAATWDPELLREVGAAIADECLALGVGVLLGPGVNIKRWPLGGRSFEYLSEDPLLAGELATAYIEGVQQRGVGTSLKHLAGNDQETRRMTIDAVYDERTLRELELQAFELPVTRAQPWTVMCSYNRLNGTYAAEHGWLLTDVLKREWGHQGIVVTDWGAMHRRVDALAAGCELQMPGPDPEHDQAIVAAVTAGTLAAEVLDEAATRLVAMALAAEANRRPDATVDHDAHHALARRVAAEGVVLCRNLDAALPLRDDDRVALIGAFAEAPRYQGTGSSRINPTRLDDLRTQLTELVGEDRLTYAKGYRDATEVDDQLVAEALQHAADADVVVVHVGLPDGYENEGNDRPHLRLPPTHDALVAALAAVHDRVVVVLANGAPVELPWADDVAAIVEGYLGGQAGAGALADVLTGRAEPGGRLAETFPLTLTDVPADRHAPGGTNTVEHREGLYVGYRFHDTVDAPVRFPFGHGLSYTSFRTDAVTVDRTELTPEELAAGAEVAVSVTVTNTGPRPGATVVQVYVRDLESVVYRPDRELGGFAKVRLAAGETRTVTIGLPERAFAFYDVEAGAWRVEPGRFELLVGRSSRDLEPPVAVTVTGEPFPRRDEPVIYRRPPRYLDVDAGSYSALLGRPLPPNPGFPPPYDVNTPIAQIAGTVPGRLVVKLVERRVRSGFGDDPANEALVGELLAQAPMRSLLMGGITHEQLDMILDVVNGNWSRGGSRALRQVRELLEQRWPGTPAEGDATPSDASER